MSTLIILLGMIAIYGRYAVFSHTATDEAGRRFTLGAWIVCSLGVLGLFLLDAEGNISSGSDSIESLFILYLLYGMAMSIFLEKAVVVHLSTPLLLAIHGMALASLWIADIGYLFLPAIIITPFVVRATIASTIRTYFRIAVYTWCMLVLAAYTGFFIYEGILHTQELSTLLLALPFLFVQLSAVFTMLVLFLPPKTFDWSTITQSYRDGFAKILSYTQLRPLPIVATVAFLAISVGVMAIGSQLGQTGLAFALIYAAALLKPSLLYSKPAPTTPQA